MVMVVGPLLVVSFSKSAFSSTTAALVASASGAASAPLLAQAAGAQ